MDDYLAKPIDVAELVETIERFGGDGPRPTQRANAPAPPGSSEQVFDEQAALAHTAGDRRLLAEMVALFRWDAPSYVRRITLALKKRDGDGLRMAAHGLKGALATVGSERGRTLAAELEQMGRAGQLDDAAAAIERLREHLKRLDKAFTSAGLVLPSSPASPVRATRRPSASRPRGRS
jgi:HPt (histidine-containing phosphotransfer) domain-containing protein